MKLKNKIVITFIVLSKMMYPQNPVGLSFDNYIDAVQNHHPLINRAGNLVQGAEYEYKAQKGEFDPLISGNFENKFYNDKNYYSVLYSEIKQPIFTSQYLKAGYEYGDGLFLNPEQKTSSYGMPFVGVEASLLQGMLIDKRRAGVLKAREYINFSKAEKNEITNNLLREALFHYTDLSFLQKQLAIYEYFIKLARERNNGITALAKSGEKPAVDTVEASILYQSRLLELQSLKIEMQNKYAGVNSFNWINTDTPTPVNTEISTDSLNLIYDKMKNLLIRELNNDSINNPVLAQYLVKKNILTIEKRLKAEMIKPKLDVRYNFISSGTSMNNMQFSANNYKWGASLSMPLLLRTSRNQFKSASLDVKNISLEVTSKTNQFQNKLNYLKQSIITLTEQLNNAARNAAFSKALLSAEKLKFDNGESSLFLLNTRENKWLESELKLSEYKLKFIDAVLNLIHIKGNLNYK